MYMYGLKSLFKIETQYVYTENKCIYNVYITQDIQYNKLQVKYANTYDNIEIISIKIYNTLLRQLITN